MFIKYLLLAARVLDDKLVSPLRRVADVIIDYNPNQPRGQPNNRGQFKKNGGGSSTSSEPRPITLGKKEYGRVMSAINTVFYARFAGEDEGSIANGNYIYYFLIRDFADYVFWQKIKIK